ncbi:hypothetical protein N0O92_12540 [Alkalihalobacillus sp. MEB130]|uniref:hypothetical protein n=1 Tax=Alkalihalobacillus sp. MEB130 TaxID=2976704 RepID=UPI0028DDBED6|nr:hypothetical protein [Alkalihalobacillus sp. MEB130]MDT8861063.1 hypothetical protein [Alkalihalobacillus sp. MEB130]
MKNKQTETQKLRNKLLLLFSFVTFSFHLFSYLFGFHPGGFEFSGNPLDQEEVTIKRGIIHEESIAVEVHSDNELDMALLEYDITELLHYWKVSILGISLLVAGLPGLIKSRYRFHMPFYWYGPLYALLFIFFLYLAFPYFSEQVNVINETFEDLR